MKVEVETVGQRAPRRDDMRALLGRIALFEGVDGHALDDLIAVSQVKTYRPRQVIIDPSEQSDGIFVILQGSARLYRTALGGRELTLASFGVGEIFGLAFISPEVKPKSFMDATTRPTVVCRLPREAMRFLICHHPQVALRAFDLVGYQLALMADRVEELNLYDVKTRLARTLLTLVEASGRATITMTHADLAVRVGTRQDEVTKTLRVFRKVGLIASEPYRPGILVHVDAMRRQYPG